MYKTRRPMILKHLMLVLESCLEFAIVRPWSFHCRYCFWCFLSTKLRNNHVTDNIIAPSGISAKRQSKVRTAYSPPDVVFGIGVQYRANITRTTAISKQGCPFVRLAWVLGEEDPVCKGSRRPLLGSSPCFVPAAHLT